MNRTSWIILLCTVVICIGIGFFFSWPQTNSTWKVYSETKNAKKELTEISKKKDVLTNLSKNNQLTNLFNIASNYIPEIQKSGELVIELTAIAGQNNLKVEQVTLDTGETPSAADDATDTATTDKTAAATPAADPNAISEIKFSMKVSGGFNDFLNFLKTTETSSRLITISAMDLTQAETGFSAQIAGKTYYKKGTNLEQNLANVKISQETIDKFQNLKTYGTPINLPTESGFGRVNPFDAIK